MENDDLASHWLVQYLTDKPFRSVDEATEALNELRRKAKKTPHPTPADIQRALKFLEDKRGAE